MGIGHARFLATVCFSLRLTVPRTVPRRQRAFPESDVIGRTTAVSRQPPEMDGILTGFRIFPQSQQRLGHEYDRELADCLAFS